MMRSASIAPGPGCDRRRMLEPLALRQRFQHSLSMPLPVWCRTILTRSRRLIFAGVAASVFLGAVRATFAASVDYLIDVWETKDSLPSSTVTAITQTPDGYLWIGTYNGLARFDGVRFVTFDPGNTPELGHARVQGLSLDVSGRLWISSYRGGLTSYRDGVFRRERPGQAGFDLHTTMATSSSNKVVFVSQFGEVWTRKEAGTNSEWIVFAPPSGARPIFQCAGRDGDLWFVNRDGHVVRFVGGEFKDLAADGGLGTNRVHTVVADAQGRVWAGADNEIARWNGKAEHFGGDLVLLQRHARRVQGVLAQILEELAERFRSMQDGAAVQLLDLRVQRLPFNASGPSILHLTRD